MNRLLLGITMLGAAAILGGCPIYSDQNTEEATPGEQRVCDGQSCYSCPGPTYSDACIPWQCGNNGDCDVGYDCEYNQCVSSPTSDAGSAGSDCSVTGCPNGFVCKLAGGAVSCVSMGDAGPSQTTEAGTGTPVDSGKPGDASSTTGPCNADGDCHGSGAKCIDGTCTAQSSLCSDGTQCVAAGFACVDGICLPSCNATTACPAGYGCDFTRGVCDLNPGACTGQGTSTCEGGATCVEGHCVVPCDTTSDVVSSCAVGEVCVNGGCLANQAASFACTSDGDQGQAASACADGYTCLHHDCYPSCSLDGGATCAGPANGNPVACKNVTIETGTYAVCAATGTLGSDCDAAQGKYCSVGTVCINGSCM